MPWKMKSPSYLLSSCKTRNFFTDNQKRCVLWERMGVVGRPQSPRPGGAAEPGQGSFSLLVLRIVPCAEDVGPAW